MSRELKRVPLDFNWPLRKTWEGFLNPHQPDKCQECGGTGGSPQSNYLNRLWYGSTSGAKFDPSSTGSVPFKRDHPAIKALAERNFPGENNWARAIAEAVRLAMHFNGSWCYHLDRHDVAALLKAGRLQDFTHRPRTPEQAEQLAKDGGYWMKKSNGYRPTPNEVNEWSLSGFSHDAINSYICIKAKLKRLGYPSRCAKCKGSGVLWPSPELRQKHARWRETKPPKGEGYQLWENCSEGSPVSPVFVTLDELCVWCETGATTFGSSTATAEQWRTMFDADFVCHKEGNNVFM